MTMLRGLAAALALLGISGFATPAYAQVLYGSIVGNVTDSSGAAVSDATVSATQTETNKAIETKTNDTGVYTLSNVPAGTFNIRISKPGFETFNAQGVTVTLNSAVRVDATLALGSTTQSVVVSSEAVALQTDRADVHSEITTKALQDIPVTGRSYQSLLFLSPGISQADYFQTGGINNPSRSMSITVNGTPNNDVVVRIDGVSAINQWLQFIQAYTPAIEAIETVNTVTSSFDAEQGMAGGASVNLQIKSGTNAFHGSAFEYVTNRALRARGFFLPATQNKPQDNKNVFGGTMGGPIIRNKLFFFGSWESTVQRAVGGPYVATSSFLTLPDAAVRTGDFSRTGTTIYDPATGNADGTGRTPFPGNIIPPSRQNPIVSQKLIPLLPLPQFPLTANNYFSVPRFTTTYHKLDTKITWNAGSKLAVNGRFSYLPDDEFSRGFYPGEVNPLSLGVIANSNVVSGSLGATWTVSPTFVVDGVYGLTRQHTQQHPEGPNQCWGNVMGIPGSCQPGMRDYALPRQIITGWTTLGGTSLYDYLDPQYQYVANAAWMRGSHNIRFGVDMHRLHMNHYEIATLPSFTYTGGVTALRGGPAPNQYNAFGDFLLGLPNSYVTGAMNPPGPGADPERPATLRGWEFGLYVRDQWQVNRKLTVSAGLRWEYYPVMSRADRGIEFYDFNANRQLICGVGGNPGDCGVHVSPLLFAPRIGIAWRPLETLVIRTGFSLNWQQDLMYRNGLYSYPTQITQSQTGIDSYRAAGSLSDGFPAVVPVDISSGSVRLPSGSGITTLPEDFIRGYIMSWNFTVQKSLAHNLTAQAGYVGTRGVKLLWNQNVNYGLPGGGAASQPFFRTLGITAAMNILLPMNHTTYDSLQASLTRRFSAGLQLNAGYTFSKSIAAFAGNIPIPQYFNLNRGLQGGATTTASLAQVGDVPHKFTLSAVQELPFGKGKRYLSQHGFLSALGGGWQVNLLFSAISGTPFTVSASTVSLNAPGSPQRADQVKSDVAILGGAGPGQPWFDPLAFASVNDPRFGTAGFNTVRGPGLVNLDAGLFRQFRLTERFQLQFRAEAFNVTNTPHFANPSGTNVSNMQLNPDGTIRNLNGFGLITSTRATGRDFDERYLRLGLRLSW